MVKVSSNRRLWLAAGGAVLLWALAYSDSVTNSFHFDDDHVIQRNQWIWSLRNIPKFFQDARTFSTFSPNANYRPLVSTTLAIDYAIAGGLYMLPFHIDQLLFFLLVGVLFFFVARALLDQAGETSWNSWAALFASALFCLHTGNTEPANYISARSELLCAAGVLGAFLVYLRLPKLRPTQLFLVPMIVGALGKTPAVIFGPLLLAYKVIFEGAPTVHSLKTMAGWKRVGWAALTGLPAVIVSGITFKLVEGMNPPGQSYGGSDRIGYLRTQVWVWLRYLKLFVLPTGLSADNDVMGIDSWKDPRVVIGGVVFVLSLVLAVLAALKPVYRPISLGILWFWAGIAPSSTIFPLAELTNDHRMYLGWLGLSLAVTAFVFERASVLLSTSPRAETWRTALTGLAITVLCAHAIGTFARNRVWTDEGTLWADVVVKSPGNGRGWMNYGLTKMSHGDYAQAKDAFERASKLVPTYSILEVNRGILASAMGDPKEAEEHFRRSLNLIPRSGESSFFYARFLVDQGRAAEAIPLLQQAAKMDFGDPRARHLLMELAAARDQQAEVQTLARELLARGTADPEAEMYLKGTPPFTSKTDDAKGWFDAGMKYTNAHRHALAAQAYRMSLRRDPNYPDSWNNLGWSLLSLGVPGEAIEPFRRTLQLRPGDPLARNNLPEAVKRLSAQGRLSRATP